MFQGLQPNLLSSADADQGLAVPDGFQGQQSSPGTLFFMPVVQLLPWFSILGRQTLEADSAIHDTLKEYRKRGSGSGRAVYDDPRVAVEPLVLSESAALAQAETK